MGMVTVSGALLAGPPSAGEGFPAMLANAPLSLINSPKQMGVATGVLSRLVNQPSPAFGPLQGVGPTDTVTAGDLLYLKCDGLLILRVTTDDGSGGSVVELNPVHGLYVREFSTVRALKLLEVQGVARCEYFISGQR